ncbi:MAG TPA: cytochrome c3 family protein, partial [Candidatus Polarisedimenticolia bacterium]|nr:cytochrome c3 family protein [Candidatus Polarisedimenticolia bacterium]
ELVEQGHGIHNVDFAFAVLRRSHDDMNTVRRTRGMAPLPLPWVETGGASPCLRCHQGIATQRGSIFGRAFAHRPHLEKAGLECAACHRPHAERAKGEIVRFSAAGCESCHHADAKAACLNCHAGIRTRKVQSPLGSFDHAFHLDEAGQGCSDCHELAAGKPVRLKTETCQGCHG